MIKIILERIFIGSVILLGLLMWAIWVHQNDLMVQHCMDHITECEAQYYSNHQRG